jgi:hypothetical protein
MSQAYEGPIGAGVFTFARHTTTGTIPELVRIDQPDIPLSFTLLVAVQRRHLWVVTPSQFFTV